MLDAWLELLLLSTTIPVVPPEAASAVVDAFTVGEPLVISRLITQPAVPPPVVAMQ